MDLFTLIIGILVAVAVGLGVVALAIGSKSQFESVRDNPEFQARVNENLKPFGTVVLTGQGPASAEATPAVATPAPVAAPLSGPQVFNQACNACHGGGINGAPKPGDTADWSPRIAQGLATLRKHAIEGYQGSKGVMPAKGGFLNLSDAEVEAAVEYMVSQSR
jgi:cytochrome c5